MRYVCSGCSRSEFVAFCEQMVPPRGCAFVSMTWRKEAAKALDRMKGFKLNSSALRVRLLVELGKGRMDK